MFISLACNETIRYVSLSRYAIYVETANVRGSHGSQQGLRHILGLPMGSLIDACYGICRLMRANAPWQVFHTFTPAMAQGLQILRYMAL